MCMLYFKGPEWPTIVYTVQCQLYFDTNDSFCSTRPTRFTVICRVSSASDLFNRVPVNKSSGLMCVAYLKYLQALVMHIKIHSTSSTKAQLTHGRGAHPIFAVGNWKPLPCLVHNPHPSSCRKQLQPLLVVLASNVWSWLKSSTSMQRSC